MSMYDASKDRGPHEQPTGNTCAEHELDVEQRASDVKKTEEVTGACSVDDHVSDETRSSVDESQDLKERDRDLDTTGFISAISLPSESIKSCTPTSGSPSILPEGPKELGTDINHPVTTATSPSVLSTAEQLKEMKACISSMRDQLLRISQSAMNSSLSFSCLHGGLGSTLELATKFVSTLQQQAIDHDVTASITTQTNVGRKHNEVLPFPTATSGFSRKKPAELYRKPFARTTEFFDPSFCFDGYFPIDFVTFSEPDSILSSTVIPNNMLYYQSMSAMPENLHFSHEVYLNFCYIIF